MMMMVVVVMTMTGSTLTLVHYYTTPLRAPLAQQ
jgi:hypothetical protein